MESKDEPRHPQYFHVTPAALRPGDLITAVRTRVYPGVRHEVHNEPTTRDDVVQEILAFTDRVTEG